METTLTVRRARTADRDAVIEACARAAVDEAVSAWVLEGHPVVEFQAVHVPVLIDKALEQDEIWVAGADNQIWTVSLWQHVTSLARFTEDAVQMREQAAAMPDARVFQRASYVMDLLERTHPREFPHSYLQLIVTVPEHRGHGAGAAIIADRLKSVSDAGLPAFLEASTERSARLYTRLGFVREPVTHTLPEGGPTLVPMWFRG